MVSLVNGIVPIMLAFESKAPVCIQLALLSDPSPREGNM
jgi:hypothetical protein